MAGIGEADRQRAIDELARRAALGDLTPDELADRTRRARTVTTHAGLEGILLDLPTPTPPPPPVPLTPAPAGTAETGTAETGTAVAGTEPAPAGPVDPGPVRWKKPGSLVAFAVVGLGLVWTVVSVLPAGDPDPSPTPDEPPRAVPETPVAPASTVPASTAPAGPHDPVTLIVGRDIPPGRLTADPLELELACRWERVHADEDGVLDELRGDGVGRHTIMDVDPTDTAVVATGCGPWRPYVPPATPATTITDGDWLVGGDIAPGRYVALAPPEDEYCSWERGRSFSGADGDVIAIPHPDLRVLTVTLEAGERFSTGGCGPWTRRDEGG